MGVSKIAKKPIPIPTGVAVFIEDIATLKVSFGLKECRLVIPSGVLVDVSGDFCKITFSEGFSNFPVIGTFASKLKAAVSDVQSPRKKTVNLIGVGFKAFKANGNLLVLSLGFSHLVAIEIPDGITLDIRENNKIDISGFKERVSAFASDLCAMRSWDPCKRSGVVVDGSYLRYKEGKKK